MQELFTRQARGKTPAYGEAPIQECGYSYQGASAAIKKIFKQLMMKGIMLRRLPLAVYRLTL
jgi:hypothetical protein